MTRKGQAMTSFTREEYYGERRVRKTSAGMPSCSVPYVIEREVVECPVCEGSGKAGYKIKCRICDGYGVVEEHEVLDKIIKFGRRKDII